MKLRQRLVGTLMCLSIGVQSVAQTQTYLPPLEVKQTLDQGVETLERLLDLVPAQMYSLDAKVDALDFDPDMAVEFVTQEIAFDPYVGVLRGPSGTLSTQAGSSWDQAVLLAAMLRSTAVDAMVVTGDLTAPEAKSLLMQTFAKRPAFEDFIDPEQLTAALSDRVSPESLEAQLEVIDAQATDILADQVDQVSSNLLQHLVDIGVGFDKSTAKLEANLAKSYAWVRYREVPSQPWIDVHPAFGASAAPSPEPTAFYADTVPKDVLHNVEMKLEIEQTTGDKVTRTQILTPLVVPAANLSEQQTSIAVGPNAAVLPGETPGHYMPLINGALPKGAKSFNRLGFAVNSQDAASGPAVFETLSEKASKALDALNSTTGDSDALTPKLSGVILSVTTTAPGQKARTEERRVFDLATAPDPTGRDLISFEAIIDVGVGAENGARKAVEGIRSTQTLLKVLPYQIALAEQEISFGDYINHPMLKDTRSANWGNISLLGNGFEPVVTAQEVVVRTGPRIVTRRLNQDTDDNGLLLEVIDIMHHDTVALKLADGVPVLAQEINLRQGIRETAFESVLIGKAVEDTWIAGDVSTTISSKAELAALLDETSFAAETRKRLQDDFDKSGLILMASTTDDPRWWRIDKDSGQILGMSRHGGAETSKRVILTNFIFTALISGGMFLYGAYKCEDTYAKNAKMRACCQIGNAVIAGAGFYVGIYAGKALAAGGFLTAIGKITVNLLVESVFNAYGYAVGAMAEHVCKGITK